MNYEEAQIFGFNVEYHIEPGQKQSWDDPGYESEIIIDTIKIDGNDIAKFMAIDDVNKLADKMKIKLEKGDI